MNRNDVPIMVKKLREKLGLTQEQLAQEVGVTFSTINHWENGKRQPHPFLLKRLLGMAEDAGLKEYKASGSKKR